MKKNNQNCYNREPLYTKDEIPFFSEDDLYIKNYDDISSDHVAYLTKYGHNPFMDEQHQKNLETSTRKLILENTPQGGKIMDVGVGTGDLFAPLDQYERYGIDISSSYLPIAKKAGIKVAMSKIEDIPYKKNFFDTVVATDVLEHVLDLTFCSHQILSCLKPGGILIVRVPYKENLSSYLKNDQPYNLIHLRNFDKESLCLHFEKIFGMETLKTETIGKIFFGDPARLKIKLLPKKALENFKGYVKRNKEFSEVLDAFNVTREFFSNWLNELRISKPQLYDAVQEELIEDIEINAVFKKPIKKTALDKNLEKIRIPLR